MKEDRVRAEAELIAKRQELNFIMAYTIEKQRAKLARMEKESEIRALEAKIKYLQSNVMQEKVTLIVTSVMIHLKKKMK